MAKEPMLNGMTNGHIIEHEQPPAEQQELKNVVDGLLRSNSLGIDQPLDWLPVKGHA